MDGILLIDKPAGITSFGVVDRIRRRLKKKAGHAGTLDPQATGLLLIMVGRATKVAEYLYELEKEYIAKCIFGISTDTQDIWGRIEKKEPASELREEDVSNLLPRFIGKIEQTPPMVSALHHKGERLYMLAKKGEVVERRKRLVTIYEMTLTDFKEGEHPEATFAIRCSGGTYIRTLFSDIGEAVSKGAALSYLRRIRIGSFTLDDAITIDSFAEVVKEDKVKELVIPINDALSHLPEAIVDDPFRVLYGQPFRYSGPDGLFRILSKDSTFLGIGKGVRRTGRPVKVIARFDDLY